MTSAQLKKIRLKLRLSQRAIADELELSERYWIYRESGEKPIPRWLSRAVRDMQNNPSIRP